MLRGMTTTDSDSGDVRRFLLAACPDDVLEELALHVDAEGVRMLEAAIQGEVPTAFELAGWRRRRAAVWARLAEVFPHHEERAEAEREAWLLAEGRHAQEAVLRATGASGAE
jgi:hypothetical protein